MKNLFKSWFIFGVLALGVTTTAVAQNNEAQTQAPNVLMDQLSQEVLGLLLNDAKIRSGDVEYIQQVVNEKVMPHVNFTRMTAMAVGPAWRQATEQQKKDLQHELEMMLIRTYAGALDQVSAQCKVVIKPFRGGANDTDVMVNSDVKCGNGSPIELSYRLRLEKDGWKIYNVNVAGVWMVENYRSQFQSQINAGGVQGLIDAMKARNIELSKQNNAK